MKFLSLRPFVPSGKDYEQACLFFEELGFTKLWDMGDYAGFDNNGSAFILQRYDNKSFAENFMISVGVEDAVAFRAAVFAKQLPEKYGIRVGEVCNQPYGLEVNVIDLAGVCWHFVQAQ
jgi:hypothetical protein